MTGSIPLGSLAERQEAYANGDCQSGEERCSDRSEGVCDTENSEEQEVRAQIWEARPIKIS